MLEETHDTNLDEYVISSNIIGDDSGEDFNCGDTWRKYTCRTDDKISF